jgi:uncharacterized protein YciI
MVRRMCVLVLCAAAIACCASALAAQRGPRGRRMETYYVGLVYKGSAWVPRDAPGAAEMQKAHLANIRRLAQSGRLVLAGPFTDDGDLRGMFVFRASSLEEAQALCDTDPAVQSGRLRVELHPWYSAKGITVVQPADSAAAEAADTASAAR